MVHICVAIQCIIGIPFPRHERTPNISLSEFNLVQETVVDFTILPTSTPVTSPPSSTPVTTPSATPVSCLNSYVFVRYKFVVKKHSVAIYMKLI